MKLEFSVWVDEDAEGPRDAAAAKLAAKAAGYRVAGVCETVIAFVKAIAEPANKWQAQSAAQAAYFWAGDALRAAGFEPTDMLWRIRKDGVDYWSGAEYWY